MQAKKSLGQHWLTSVAARDKIVAAASLTPSDTVLEVGPGEGFLTRALLAQAGRVVAVEKDDRLISTLEQGFATEIATGKLVLVHDDILNLKARQLTSYKLQAGNFKIVANIPYYITGQFFKLFLESAHQPSQMVILVQKEVAERVVARDNKESLLSISIKVFGEPKYVTTVKAGSFSPPPSVDSAILSIENISHARLEQAGITPDQFFAVLKQGFAHKRKQLKNNLATHWPSSTAALATCKIESNARAEDLTLADWLCLAPTLITSSPPSAIGS